RCTFNGDSFFANPQLCRMLGLKNTQHGWMQMTDPDDLDKIHRVWELLRKEHHCSGEKEKACIAGVDGRTLIGDLALENTGYVCVLTDVTEMRKLEECRLAAVKLAEEHQRKRAEEAEEQQHSQQMFVDSMCHELRNPLNGIFGGIDMLVN